MESEVELNDEIQKLHIIATVPEHYTLFMEMNTVHTLVGLLNHDNSDISIAYVDLPRTHRYGHSQCQQWKRGGREADGYPPQ